MQARLSAILALILCAELPLASAAQQQQAIPDAPTPQPALSGIPEVTPGKGTGPDAPAPPRTGNQVPQSQSSGQAPDQTSGSSSSSTSDSPESQQPNVTPVQPEAPDIPSTGQGPQGVLRIPVNEVIVPVTVRDKKGRLVPSLDWRMFRVYEDGVRQRIVFFTTDPFPLSVAFVVDQSLPADVMHRVNNSLAAVTGAFTPADTVAVFGYNSSPKLITDFTAAQGNRLPMALESAKAPGRDMGVDAPGGPLDNGPQINGKDVDPNLSPHHGQDVGFTIHPKEDHPLNDAILAAAVALSKEPKERRKIIYIISDGKEQGSKASYKEVVRFLLSHDIALHGTLVGDSAIWGLGYLDKIHIPLLPTMRDNLLPKYALATGGALDSEVSENGIQASFAKITDSVRTQYTLGYLSHAGIMASRFHTIEVRIEGIPNLDITARDGYYPSASDLNR